MPSEREVFSTLQFRNTAVSVRKCVWVRLRARPSSGLWKELFNKDSSASSACVLSRGHHQKMVLHQGGWLPMIDCNWQHPMAEWTPNFSRQSNSSTKASDKHNETHIFLHPFQIFFFL